MKFKRTIRFFSFQAIVSYLIISSCAKIGTITGGAKDVTPPKIVASAPVNYSTNFKGKKAQITFDEFIQLKDIDQQLNVSPPLKKKPIVKLKGKTMYIDFSSDTLKDSTTYTFNFGNSIADLNEGNILQNYEFAFSTGPFLDSMSVEGQVVSAFDLTSDKDPLLAMLYKDLSDSAPYKQRPTYTSRTDKDGNFFISHVKEGDYRLYALKDANFNYKFDPPSENFAFRDSLAHLYKGVLDAMTNNKKPVIKALKVKTQTKEGLKKGMVGTEISKADTAKRDTAKLKRDDKYALHVELFTFKEKERKQFIKDYFRKDRHFLEIIFNRSLLDDSLKLVPLYYKARDWYFLEKNKTHDTIEAWITDSTIYKIDTLRTKIYYTGVTMSDSTKATSEIINFRYLSKESGKKKGEKQSPLTLSLNISNSSTLGLYDDIAIESNYPVSKIDTGFINLSLIKDSVGIPHKYDISKDTTNKRRFDMHFKREEQNSFSLKIFPGAFQDIYGDINDTLKYDFTMQKADYYGNLFVTLTGVQGQILVQLLQKDNVERQIAVRADGKYEFEHLIPKSYTLKFVYDTNKNGKWDTGNFHKKRQPEKVEFYKEEVNVRANWDVEVSWDLGDTQ